MTEDQLVKRQLLAAVVVGVGLILYGVVCAEPASIVGGGAALLAGGFGLAYRVLRETRDGDRL